MSGITKYVVLRILSIFPMLLAVSLLIFFLINLAPGGPETVILGDSGRFDPHIIEMLREHYGLNKPIYVRYWLWLKKALVGDFGYATSGVGLMHVSDLILQKLGPTVQLGAAALFLAVIISIPLGVVSAVYRYSWLDRIATLGAFAGICLPSFWVGIMLILIFSFHLGWFPLGDIAPIGQRGDILLRIHHAILPTVTLALLYIGRYTRFMRSSVLEVMNEDYIRTARAKGLPERVVLAKHILRNSLISVVTLIGLSLDGLVSGTVIIESVFSWPGVGRFAVWSVLNRDYQIIMGINMMIATAVLSANIITDVVYALVDPRISFD